MIELSEVSGIIEKEPILKNLIKEEKIDGEKYVEFSAIGEVFYNRFEIESKRTLPKDSNNIKNFEKDFTYNESEENSKASLKDGKLMKFLREVHKRPPVS